jgi:hypothetical protein
MDIAMLQKLTKENSLKIKLKHKASNVTFKIRINDWPKI